MSSPASAGLTPSLDKLRRALADSDLQAPRPLIDMGLSNEQIRQIEERFKLTGLAPRPAAVLIPIQPAADEPHIILTQRADTLKHHAGQISFPGGSRESQDPDLAHTALRESHEEIALDPQHVEIMGYLPDYPTITGFQVTPVVGLVAENAQVHADQVEVTAIHRLPLSILIEEGRLRRRTMQREGLELPIFEIEHSSFHVWGATAGMLYALRELLLGRELPLR